MVHIVFLFNSDSAHNALQVTPQLYGAWISIRLVTVWLAAVMIEPSEYGPRDRYHYYPLPRPPNPQYFRGLNRIGGFYQGVLSRGAVLSTWVVLGRTIYMGGTRADYLQGRY